jgi:hypothetical protein
MTRGTCVTTSLGRAPRLHPRRGGEGRVDDGLRLRRGSSIYLDGEGAEEDVALGRRIEADAREVRAWAEISSTPRSSEPAAATPLARRANHLRTVSDGITRLPV